MTARTQKAALIGEAKAWRMVARKLERTRAIDYGLCSEIGDLPWKAPHEAMYDRIAPHVALSSHRFAPVLHPTEGQWFAYPRGEEWEARCLAAYWLALECEDEAR